MRALLALLALASCRQIFGLRELKKQDAPSHGDDGGLPDAAYKDARYPDTPPGYFRIGGTVSGLTATGLVLQNNGGDDLPRMADGPFQFAIAIADGGAYAVTVSAQPTEDTCSVANSSGNVSGSDVTNVMVTCSPSGGSGVVHCAAATCAVGGATPDCCGVGSSFVCVATCPTGGFLCDGVSDCTQGVTDVCCVTVQLGNAAGSMCTKTSMCASGVYFCDPNDATPCPSGERCQPSGLMGAPPNYSQCL
jgi:hypothetical protein